MTDYQATMDRLREQAWSDQRKLTYFALGVAASAIAFGFHETAERSTSLSLYVIAGAGFAWATSFAAGILSLEAGLRLSNMDVHKVAIEVWKLRAPDASKDPTVRAHDERYERWGRRATRRFYAQLWMLLIGAAIYAAGHGLHLTEISRVPSGAAIAPTAAPLTSAATSAGAADQRQK